MSQHCERILYRMPIPFIRWEFLKDENIVLSRAISEIITTYLHSTRIDIETSLLAPNCEMLRVTSEPRSVDCVALVVMGSCFTSPLLTTSCCYYFSCLRTWEIFYSVFPQKKLKAIVKNSELIIMS